MAYLDKGEYDRAIADYDQAIRLKPDYADAYNNRASPTQQGRLRPRHRRLRPGHPAQAGLADAYNNRGIAYDEGRYDRAIADFDQAIRLKPDYAEAYYNRGIAYDRRAILQRRWSTSVSPRA